MLLIVSNPVRVLFVILALLASSSSVALAEVSFAAHTLNSGFVQAGTAAPQTSSVQDHDVALQSGGGESSQCTPYGRPSAAQASANVLKTQDGTASLTLTFLSRSYASGGHFRTCLGGCVAGACLGLHGNDTKATANSQAIADVAIAVNDERKFFAYDATILGSTNDIQVSLSYADGTPVLVKAGSPNHYIMNEKQHIVRVHASLSTEAKDNGGCCSSVSLKSGTLSISIEQGALLTTSYSFSPFIKGGKPTTAYPSVVSIGLGGHLHCSGTYIGGRSVLTAAHCIYAYDAEMAAGKMDVRFGSDFYNAEKTIVVSGGTVPDDGAQKFNPKTFEDDIGIITIASDPKAAAATMVPSPADWNAFIEKHAPVSIVGFGFNVIDGGAVNPGVKREARILIDPKDVKNRSIAFANLQANTCNGDSGGPTFVEVDGTKLYLVAVTSGGDDACTRGVNTRIDPFSPWITSHRQ